MHTHTGQIRAPCVRRYDDEEEFDGVAGEVLLPKRLYVCAVEEPPPASSSQQDAYVQECVAALQAQLPGRQATAGFCAKQVWLAAACARTCYELHV